MATYVTLFNFTEKGAREIKDTLKRVEAAKAASGKVMEDYMGVKGIEAEHVTLAIENPHTEVQLLRYRKPEMIVDADILKPNKLGFNHICFAVDDLEAEIAKLTAAGVRLRNKMMDFHSRKLVFVHGPENITVELAEWH
jgi:catechol 2,3-dioxygenase-like lactoylglutathione lyase family enzyme